MIVLLGLIQCLSFLLKKEVGILACVGYEFSLPVNSDYMWGFQPGVHLFCTTVLDLRQHRGNVDFTGSAQDSHVYFRVTEECIVNFFHGRFYRSSFVLAPSCSDDHTLVVKAVSLP